MSTLILQGGPLLVRNGVINLNPCKWFYKLVSGVRIPISGVLTGSNRVTLIVFPKPNLHVFPPLLGGQLRRLFFLAEERDVPLVPLETYLGSMGLVYVPTMNEQFIVDFCCKLVGNTFDGRNPANHLIGIV